MSSAPQFQKAAFTRDLTPTAHHYVRLGEVRKTAAPDFGEPSDRGLVGAVPPPERLVGDWSPRQEPLGPPECNLTGTSPELQRCFRFARKIHGQFR